MTTALNDVTGLSADLRRISARNRPPCRAGRFRNHHKSAILSFRFSGKTVKTGHYESAGFVGVAGINGIMPLDKVSRYRRQRHSTV